MAKGGPQRPDHGGNFYMVPRRVQNSIAWRHASLRARVVLSVFQFSHDGFNNGRIALTVNQVCTAMGDQNKGANGKAIAELIELGFLECVSDADHRQSKAREYRITFIPAGQGKHLELATHEYADWRPGPMQSKKFGGARTAPQNPVSGAVTAPTVKFSGAVTAPSPTENCGFEPPTIGAVTAPLLGNQSSDSAILPGRHAIVGVKSPAAEISVPIDELRRWVTSAIEVLGSARRLAQSAGLPEPTLSRFRGKKSLPDRFRLPLQEACARVVPYRTWREAA